tara:strand:- start:234 stop:632 length:399 start_codon:yes stop_codon:yes gene_type:complete
MMTDVTPQDYRDLKETAILRVFTAVVWIDGDLHDAEKSALASLAEQLTLSPEKVSAVWDEFVENVDTVADLFGLIVDDLNLLKLAPNEVKALLLGAATMLMESDGENHPNEKALIATMAKAWSVPTPEGVLD